MRGNLADVQGMQPRDGVAETPSGAHTMVKQPTEEIEGVSS
jgi:hypothetical protein